MSALGYYSGDCSHATDVGVWCAQSAVRLVGGSSSNVGVVEVTSGGGSWGTLCDTASPAFSTAAATVVCAQVCVCVRVFE